MQEKWEKAVWMIWLYTAFSWSVKSLREPSSQTTKIKHGSEQSWEMSLELSLQDLDF